MKWIVLDSCSIINFINSSSIDDLVKLNGFKFLIGELVYDECSDILEQKSVIDKLVNENSLLFLKDGISFNEFKEIKNNHELGDGESESIALARKLNYNISTDDKKARKSALKELGSEKVLGSLYLLREMVFQKLITCSQSILIFKEMKNKGGFLPSVDESYLCR